MLCDENLLIAGGIGSIGNAVLNRSTLISGRYAFLNKHEKKQEEIRADLKNSKAVEIIHLA